MMEKENVIVARLSLSGREVPIPRCCCLPSIVRSGSLASLHHADHVVAKEGMILPISDIFEDCSRKSRGQEEGANDYLKKTKNPVSNCTGLK